jgi:O-acetyl-ADP-ribose deacetylase (regulator of RNase III)
MAQSWGTKVTIRQGDLTDAMVDAIVNAANNDFAIGRRGRGCDSD